MDERIGVRGCRGEPAEERERDGGAATDRTRRRHCDRCRRLVGRGLRPQRALDGKPGIADIALTVLEVLLEATAQQLADRGGNADGRRVQSGSRCTTAARMSVVVSPRKAVAPVSIS